MNKELCDAAIDQGLQRGLPEYTLISHFLASIPTRSCLSRVSCETYRTSSLRTFRHKKGKAKRKIKNILSRHHLGSSFRVGIKPHGMFRDLGRLDRLLIRWPRPAPSAVLMTGTRHKQNSRLVAIVNIGISFVILPKILGQFTMQWSS